MSYGFDMNKKIMLLLSITQPIFAMDSHTNCLYCAVDSIKIDIVREYLEGGCNPDNFDAHDSSPLIIAIKKLAHPFLNLEIIPIIKLLLEYNANPKLPDKNGKTPLSHMLQSNAPPAVALLLHAGADANQVDDRHCTPLMYAASYSRNEQHGHMQFSPNPRLVRLLLYHGADTKKRTRAGIAENFATGEIQTMLRDPEQYFDLHPKEYYETRCLYEKVKTEWLIIRRYSINREKLKQHKRDVKKYGFFNTVHGLKLPANPYHGK